MPSCSNVDPQEPGLSEFTATDRRGVIDRLLSDDYVLEALHHVIFSAPTDADPSAGGGGASPGATGAMTGQLSPIMGVKVPGVATARSDDTASRPEQSYEGACVCERT